MMNTSTVAPEWALGFNAVNVARLAPIEPLQLTVTEARDDGCVTRCMHVDDRTIYFKTTADTLPPPLETWDFAVIASIFTAMRQGRALRVRGPVSTSLLRKLEEFQEAWATWLPNHYRVVDVIADLEVEPQHKSKGKGVFAFSGGVDATFSLLRHVRKKAGRRNITPVAAALIKGFDIALGDERAFAIARANAQAMLSVLEVPLAIVETNWKNDLCYTWEMEHAAGLVACLAQFAGLADVAVLGGDEEGYDKIDIPWGSNLISNPLLSSDSLTLRTEGSGVPRSERLAFIIANSSLAPHLRVCWENAHTGTNCGVCEKCIRTQLNFRAVGAEPRGFLKTAGFLRIATIPSKSLSDNYFLLEIQHAASRRHIRGAWRTAAYIGIFKNILFSPMFIAREKLIFALRQNETLYRRIKQMARSIGRMPGST